MAPGLRSEGASPKPPETEMPWLYFMSVLFGCGESEPLVTCAQLADTEPLEDGGNILVIVADDIGVDKLSIYDQHPNPARTPNIDALSCAGVTFNNAYSNPVCSPTRAAIMTGRHGARTGIGRWIHSITDSYDLPLSEETIAERLNAMTEYTSVALGKWHLVSHKAAGEDGVLNPNLQGFSYYAGALGNPREALQKGHLPRTYEDWEKATNGELSWSETYMTTDTVNDAVAQIQQLPEPWFTYVAFNGAHEPVHAPPKELITTSVSGLSGDVKKFDAMVEAVDTELGRLLDSIPADVLARTTIIFITDNGTPGFGISKPWDPGNSKGTLLEGGVNVPMIVTGPHVTDPGRTSDVLVHFVDLYATIADIADAPLGEQALDSISFLPTLQDPEATAGRDFVYSEKFYPNGAPPYDYHHRMVTDGDWKLIRYSEEGEVTEKLLRPDGWDDGSNLVGTIDSSPTAAAAYDRLSAALDDKIAEMTFEH